MLLASNLGKDNVEVKPSDASWIINPGTSFSSIPSLYHENEKGGSPSMTVQVTAVLFPNFKLVGNCRAAISGLVPEKRDFFEIFPFLVEGSKKFSSKVKINEF